jgi:DNA-binding NarL/FixJ family response regulator
LIVCGQAATRPAGLEAIAREKPDLVVLDISLKEGDGMDLLKDLKIQYPDLAALVLSMHDESLYAERALRAGAKGYIMKQEPPEKIMEAIRKVAAGETYLSESMTRILIERVGGHRPASNVAAGLEVLTDRELQIYQLIARGRRLREMSNELHLSVKTIASHRQNIKRKLNLKSGSELLRHALQWARDHLEL